MTARVRLTLRLDADGKPALGHGKIHLLEKLEETGSISAAGRAMHGYVLPPYMAVGR